MPEHNGNSPATKADLAALEARIDSKMEALAERLLESTHDAETRVLNAFYGYAQTTQKHLTMLDGTDANVLSRLGTVESRVLEIEKRLNIPPGQIA